MSVFSTHIVVRGYEPHTQGHLNNAVYHQYAEHAHWECLRTAGLPQAYPEVPAQRTVG
ncbi:MAG: acyl-CoA thioester hydrolase [Streptosporangiaceae bacterium]|nr:thioesterase [Streptosporangiaceae bacterium]MDX6430366.1 acyl-CoA thioester hydrolase [Streptosporangiaceae bacterium]